MSEQTPYEGWTIVEQMGHKRIAGYVREQVVAGVSLLRIDVPHTEPDGEPIATQFIHASTLYAMTPTTERVVRAMARNIVVTPPASYGGFRELPPGDEGGEDQEPTLDEDVDEMLRDHRLLDVIETLRNNVNGRIGDGPEVDRESAILEQACNLLRSGEWPIDVATETLRHLLNCANRSNPNDRTPEQSQAMRDVAVVVRSEQMVQS